MPAGVHARERIAKAGLEDGGGGRARCPPSRGLGHVMAGRNPIEQDGRDARTLASLPVEQDAPPEDTLLPLAEMILRINVLI